MPNSDIVIVIIFEMDIVKVIGFSRHISLKIND